MMRYIPFILFTCCFNCAVHAQLKDEQFKPGVKSIAIITKQYSQWNDEPEMQLETTDTAYKYFNEAGRLVKEKYQRGSHFLRKISYKNDSLPDKDILYFSSQEKYPNPVIPVYDSDYNIAFITRTHHYDSLNRLKQTTIEKYGDRGKKPKNTIDYSYTGDGQLYSESNIERDDSDRIIHLSSVDYTTIIRLGKPKTAKVVTRSSDKLQVKDNRYNEQGRLTSSKITYDDGKTRLSFYDEQERYVYEEIYKKDQTLIVRFEFIYGAHGISKILSYRLPSTRSANEKQSGRLRLSEEQFYEYELYLPE